MLRCSAEGVPTLQEPPPDQSLPIRDDNRRTAELHLAPEAIVDSRQEVTAAPHTISVSTSPPSNSNAITSADYNALPQDRDPHLQKEAVWDLLPSASVALIEDYCKPTLILHPLAANSSTKKDDKEVRWDTDYCRQMNAIPKEDVSSPDHRLVPRFKGWPILDTWKTLQTLLGKRDLGTDDHGSLLFGCLVFSPSLGGHGYRPRNISGRWPEATPQGQKSKWLVANFRLDSSPLLWREMVKMPLVPALERNSGEIRWAVHYRKQNAVRKEEAFPFSNIADHLSRLSLSKISSALDGADASRLAPEANRHLPPSERLSDQDDTALHPAGAWDQLRILCDVLSTFGAARLQAYPERAQLLQDHLKYLDCEVSAQRITGPPCVYQGHLGVALAQHAEGSSRPPG